MAGSAKPSVTAADDGQETWEFADVDSTMRGLMLSSRKDSSLSSDIQADMDEVSGLASKPGLSMPDDLVNSVDQFLREAIQNPRERLSVLRMEQDLEKFIRDPSREEMEFLQLPTSYLRLAAHRLAQHYSLQSKVVIDNNLSDGSGSRITISKTSNLRLPLVRLADIPVSLPAEDSGVIKFAIKQRPQRGSQNLSSSNANSAKSNSSKSVEERKEEYNRARARIFSTSGASGSSSAKPEREPSIRDSFWHGSLGITAEERTSRGGGSEFKIGRTLSDSSMPSNSASSNRFARTRTEKEPIGRSKANNRVAIFRDREVERKDPDYCRSYDRYMQKFDPGFGFNGGPYTVQPLYSPALNYNTEFPQLGSGHRPPVSSDHQPRPLPQHLPGPWTAPSAPSSMGYHPAETILPPFGPGPVNARSASGIYLQSAQYHCQRSGLPYIHPHEPVHQPFSQEQQPDLSSGLARPR